MEKGYLMGYKGFEMACILFYRVIRYGDKRRNTAAAEILDITITYKRKFMACYYQRTIIGVTIISLH
jgi:hypothetical protein